MKFKNIYVYLLLIICLFITGCGEAKEVKSLDDFVNVTIDKGFTTKDNMNVYNTAEYILEAKVAVYNDITIEMIKYIDSEYAEKALEKHIDSFDLLKSTGAAAHVEKGSNYHSYSIVSNNRYMISSRIDDTLIFTKVLITDKETIDEIFDELGY